MRRPLRSDEARAVANTAIELGDPGRMAKARRLHRSNGVGSVDVEAGAAYASVIDAVGDVFDVEVTITSRLAPRSVPTAADLETSCSCEDQHDTCMHALAAILGVAEEIEANGRMLDVWTGVPPARSTPSYSAPRDHDQSFFGDPTLTGERIVLQPTVPPQLPPFVAEDIDAGKVFADARRTIAEGLSPYRARQ